MKQLAAIVLSLLLIAAQTLAVSVPVCGGATVASAGALCGCCGSDCQCCVGESGVPAIPVEFAAPVAAQNRSALPPPGFVLFTLASSSDEVFPVCDSAEFRAAAVPLFQRNCVFLI